jgi:DNA polymerase-3 subunit epsilon
MPFDALVFIDLETTGISPARDRIIEIGLCEVRDGVPVREWTSLVNPLRSVSPFIAGLTGITNAMVAGAPPFAGLAQELREILADKVLVAHNARFDYGFLKSEFQRLGIPFQEQVLCTVKLSRALFPKETRHNLDAIIRRHGLATADRHRALGDARLIREFFAKLRADFPAEVMDRAVRRQLKRCDPADRTGRLPLTPPGSD